ncbi:MAG: S9 family peptidase [Prevotella sp.]|nr:S9 family peptidase [Prevotella sp.]
MTRKTTIMAMLLATAPALAQQRTEIAEFNLSGPFAVYAPASIDTVDVNGRKFDETSLLKSASLPVGTTTVLKGGVLPVQTDSKTVGVLSFYVNNADYLKGMIEIKGLKNYKLYIDGNEAGTELNLAPEHHTFAIRYMSEPGSADTVSVWADCNKPLPYTLDEKHPYMVHDLTDGRRVRSISISPDGHYAVLSFQTTERGGQSRWEYELRETKNQRLVSRLSQNVRWLPRTCAYIEEVWEATKRVLYQVEPLSGTRQRLAYDVPRGSYEVSPTEDYLIVTVEEDGPKEDADVFQVLEMDDRQPDWRKRSHLLHFDLKTGVRQRLTFGTKGESLHDISQDGRRLLIGTSYSRLAKRPTEVVDLYVLDLATHQVDTLLQCEGFLDDFSFTPDARKVLVKGNPEAFNRVGCQLPASVTPSMTESELFILDIASKQVTPLTKDFDPSVQSVRWSQADGLVYFSAEDRDYVRLYSLHPASGKISQLPVSGDNVYRFSVAAHAPVLGYLSYETMAPASAYVFSQKKNACLFDGREALGSAELGTCQDWNFTNSKGETVYGRLYLPKDFDASKKYPMIVYYYGGCMPVSRYFESPYAPQMWNSLGYVAYILQPSGATGFGQEWASRHVNTAGGSPGADGSVSGGFPAGDIIEGTKKICDEHPFINREKIGCMGASYGGFMTMYLQTVTDIFAAAVSHAGIANHTSYWGEGYWGYNYSEVSMANSYPWSHRQLYVDQSPLFNADKIHTPLLLLHGTDDTNVPLIESLQMFTALKLLGRDVALVEVKGENHHVLDYKKREKWLATQMAWFQRWLKDDPSWWDALYPKKNL